MQYNKFTTRYCHFAKQSSVKVGDIVKQDDELGLIGSTGESEGIHCHIDSIVGWKNSHYRVADFVRGAVQPANEQTLYCIGQNLDKGLFQDSLPYINAPIMSATYKSIIGKDHYGNDVIPLSKDSKGILHWNRSKKGKVVYSGFDGGYGYSVIIQYEV